MILLLLAQSVSLSTETMLHVLSLVGALAAIFVRIGKFETKHDMSLGYIQKDVSSFKEMLRTELDRVEKSINKLDSEAEKLRNQTTKYATIEAKSDEHERRISALEKRLDNRERPS